jgi:hypothetical protein
MRNLPYNPYKAKCAPLEGKKNRPQQTNGHTPVNQFKKSLPHAFVRRLFAAGASFFFRYPLAVLKKSTTLRPN